MMAIAETVSIIAMVLIFIVVFACCLYPDK